MATIDVQAIERFKGKTVCVAIQDGTESEPQFSNKRIEKAAWCPDHTHIRIYFDSFRFFAIPAGSRVHQTDTEWAAFDDESQLIYLIREERVSP